MLRINSDAVSRCGSAGAASVACIENPDDAWVVEFPQQLGLLFSNVSMVPAMNGCDFKYHGAIRIHFWKAPGARAAAV